jgi:uncharacterized protein
MKFTEDKTEGLLITSYTPGEIRIANDTWQQSILIHLHGCSSWNIENIEHLSTNHFPDILAYNPDILLIGTGATQQFPEVETYAELLTLNIGVEIMDSAAASRTYNALLTDGRKVMAGIIV